MRSERDHNFRPRAATEWGTRSAVARGDVGEIQGEDGRLRVAAASRLRAADHFRQQHESS